ncbi:MAG: XRE family transcriptional regulator [Aestuariivita sp.]|nr:XRE family transcriptional regulator [Aestuariivita sp.]MCY4202838.1 XRE family transcriptional regulator [Aestuariivita sp.]
MLAKNINPNMLAWARQEIGVSLEQASKKIGLKNTKSISAAERLQAFESGEEFPTRKQLFKIAKVFRRPLVTFYLETPPAKDNRNKDFRLTNYYMTQQDRGILEALVRNIRARQDMVAQIIIEEDTPESLDFIKSVNISESQDIAVEKIHKVLNLKENRPKFINDPRKLFKELRDRIEKLGIFVLLAENYGPLRSSVSEKIFRGLTISDPIAPFIVINRHDIEPAWSFTLIHELVHLFLGSTGISGELNPGIRNPTERFCDAVAGKILIPDSDLKNIEIGKSLPEIRQVINDISINYSVSKNMVAYRLQQSHYISANQYGTLAAEFTRKWREQKEQEKIRRKKKETEGGPSYYIIQNHRLGPSLVELVARNLRDGTLSHSKAATILGTKIGSVEPLLAKVPSVSGTYQNSKV